ncbi:non-ribosomal peptide synthetase [Streptococcus porcinus]|uniref:AMP-binding enzyme n=1 Tax=Streptococcus porcinus str. Jelinkova 176 TaxID=873448 RepID=A0ABN0CX27_STRPO|nr:non-ribosomal peptide synthetase [Streptococcus porcinus]EGJ27775.1 AMP-binding enzyme [Streptococcus porcinus str. Jelinkova 176]SQG44349.1 long-chain-fatty-acid--CoA ligase [Streptococcus porcinus]
MLKLLMDTLEKISKIDPNRIAIKAQDKVLTYYDVEKLTNTIANKLVEKVGDNQRVVVALPHGINQILILIAIIKSNNCYVPIDYTTKEDKIKKIFSSTKAIIYVSDKEIPCLSDNDYLDVTELMLKNSDKLKELNPFVYLKSREAYILHTSGTTGAPKGVVISISNLDYILKNLGMLTPVTEDSSFLFSTPYTFDVSITEMLGWIIGGGSVYCLDLKVRSNYKKLDDIIVRNSISHIAFSPTAFLAFIEKLGPTNLKKLNASLDYVVIAGEKFNPLIYHIWKNNGLTFTLINAYGPTETTIYATAYKLSTNEGENIPIGLPLDGVDWIIKEEQKENHGELYIGGAGVAKGYTLPELTKEAFTTINGKLYYATGDIVFRKKGQFYYVGRKDNQIQKNGIRIELGEIEKNIEQNTNVSQVTVLQLDKKILAFYKGAIESSKLKNFCLKNMPKYLMPNSFIKVEQFPLTSSRKISKTALIKLYNDRQKNKVVDGSEQYDLDKGSKEILKLLADTLKVSVKAIDLSQDFFESGGDSLTLFTFIMDFEASYGVSVSMDNVYGKELFSLIQELKNLSKKQIQETQSITSIEEKKSSTNSLKKDLDILYTDYLMVDNEVLSKFEAIHSQRIYYYDDFRNIVTCTFEYKNCSVEKVKKAVQQVVSSNDLLHSRLSFKEIGLNFEIIKPNLSIPVLSVSNQSELISLEKLLEEVGENAIPNSRNKGGQLAMPIIITQGMMCGKIIFQMDHSISDLASINVIKKQIGSILNSYDGEIEQGESYRYYCQKIKEVNERSSLENNPYHNLLLKEAKKIKRNKALLPNSNYSLSIIPAPDYSNVYSILYLSYLVSQNLCKESKNSSLIVSTIFNNREIRNLNLHNTIGDCHSSRYLIYKENDDFRLYRKRNIGFLTHADDSVMYYRPGFIFNEYYPRRSEWRSKLKQDLTNISLVSLNFIGILNKEKKNFYLENFSEIPDFLSKNPKIYITSFRYKNDIYILSNKNMEL